ncbi:MAG: hypothetical protein EOO48_02545 [Flavobacterium sp.]|nr:MAG: hypothetical protein EOO48_02545 [Flavobacterium sp.]
MKKVILTTAAAFLLVLAACKKEEKTTEMTTTEMGGNDTTVVVHDTPPAPAPDTVVKTESTDANGTSVDVSKDGVNVSSKDGEKKTSVNVDVKK